LPLAVGDRVRLFQRTNATYRDTGTVGAIGRNGTVLTVADVMDNGLVLRTKDGRDGLVSWDSLRDRNDGRMRLAYGDVLTTYTAQGSTVSEHIFAMPAGSQQVTGFAAYTAGSRHREQSFIVTSDGAEHAEVASRRPLGDCRPIRESDIVDNLARNLARQPEKDSALALVERAEHLRRGTVERMQVALHAANRRAATGLSRGTLREAVRAKRIQDGLASITVSAGPLMAARDRVLSRLGRSVAAIRSRFGAMAGRSQKNAAKTAKTSNRQRKGPRL
jgi:hypothetical protein